MKRFVLAVPTLVLLSVLAACGSVESDAPATEPDTDTLTFSIDPSTQQAQLVEAPDSADLSLQGKLGRRVLTGEDLKVKSLKVTFQKSNVIKLDAAFKNISACNLSEFTLTQGKRTRNIVSSSEPVVTAEDLGGDAVLSPKEVTKPLTFKVKHKGKPFIYQVTVKALVSCEPQGFDLGISVTTQADTVSVGKNISYTVDIVNNGSAAVKDARFSGELGGSVTEWLVDGGFLPEGCDYANSAGTPFNKKLACKLGALAKGETRQVVLTAKALAAGDAEALFVVFPEPFEFDANGTNDGAFLTTAVVDLESTDLRVFMDGEPSRVAVGKLVTYEIRADNFFGLPATGVKLKADFELPVKLESVEPNASCTLKQVEDVYRLECDLDLTNVSPDRLPTSSTISLSVKATKAGTFSASATISSNEPDEDPSDNSATSEVEVFDNGTACIDPFVLPDHVLEGRIRETLDKPEGTITCADMASLTELDASAFDDEMGEPLYVRSLEGLQFASNLTSLSFHNSGTTTDYFEPLSGLTTLERLSIASFPFAGDNYPDIDLTFLGKLTNLTSLSLPETQVGDLGIIASLTNLSELSIPNSNLTDYSPLSKLTKLVKLNLSKNYSPWQVTDLGFLENLTALDNLNLSDNAIRDLTPLVNNKGLGYGDDVISLYYNCFGADEAVKAKAIKDVATIEARNPNVINVQANLDYYNEYSDECSIN